MKNSPNTATHCRRRSAKPTTSNHTGTINRFAGRTITIAPQTKPPTACSQPGNRPAQAAMAPASSAVPIESDKVSVR